MVDLIANRRQFLSGGATALATTMFVGTGCAGIRRKSPTGLQAHLDDEMRRAGIPGMQVAVVRRGEVDFLESFGFADIENAVPTANATLFQIASCTKAFIGVAVMQLVESGSLDIEAPVSQYLGGLPTAWRAVTVAQLAAHTSGLPDIAANYALRLVVDSDADASWAKIQTLPLEFAPGKKFSYNQTNYVLLGKLIHALSGEPFIQFIRKHQFDVAGMPSTVYGDDRDVVLHSARTYTPYALIDGKPERTKTLYKTHIEFPAMLRACGGVNTSAEELARWLIALQRGALLKNASSLTALWTTRALNDGKPGPWGIGGWIFERPDHPVFFCVGAAKAAFAIYPHDDLAVVVLTNLSADLWLPFVDAIAAHYLPGLANHA